ncbi:MAG: hypothetical protein MUE44_18205 [Oscillatoriaceae cyanobacterium Prado104]|nr:hypothetical protein [Oscillatoriaceae cyanobacterium Prado104]
MNVFPVSSILVAIVWVVGTPTMTVNLTIDDVNVNANGHGLLARSPCPENLKSLVDRLLQNLPSYANRVIARSSVSPNNSRAIGSWQRQIILAGRPEFEPLPLNSEIAVPENAHQIFITTLERQYRGGQSIEIQQFHWLFLVKTEKEWELVKIVSRFGTVADVRPLLPPVDEQSEIAEAIRLWLRDCQASR